MRTLDGWRLQVALLLAAGALWAVHPHASFGALLAAYGLAWLVFQALHARARGALAPPTSRGAAVGLAVLLALPPVAQAVRHADRLLENEALDAIDHQVEARLRLERDPAIFPPLVAADRPQSFYVHAPGARAVRARFGEGAELEAASLGHGVFRVELDPRRDGPIGDARLDVDGSVHFRAMRAVEPAPHPRWLRPAPDRRAVATTSEETDELFVLDGEGLRHRVDVDDGPTDVGWLDPGRLVVTHRYGDALAVVEDGAIARRVRIGPFARRLDVWAGDGARRVVVGRGGEAPELVFLDGDLQESARATLPAVPDWVVFGPDRGTVVVATRADASLHRFREGAAGWREDRPPLPLGRPAVTMARSPDGATVVVAVTDHGPGGPPHLGNHFVLDQLLDVDVVGWRVARATPTAYRTSRQRSPGDVDRGASPMGVDLPPDGRRLVAFAGTDDVWIEAEGSAVPELVALDDHPLATPHSAVALADGGFWVSSPVYGAFGRFDRAGRHLADVRVAPDDHALLRTDEVALQRRIGERSFFESTRSGVSCQSCHLHGGSDQARHNIGGGTLVATLDARGLLGTPPFLRDGGYPLLGSLDELSQTLYRGYLRHQGGRRVSLNRYLEDLPRPTPARRLAGRDLARERRGLAVFVEARCPLCHAPPAFTNLGQHPAEALFPDFAASHPGYELDTPSLLGLAASAPYLVDGRAATLEAVFRDHDPAGRHGDTRRLDEGRLADLVYFLEGL